MKNKKYCITCNQTGHTYLECNQVPFVELFARAFNVEPVISTLSKEELMKNIEEIRKDSIKEEYPMITMTASMIISYIGEFAIKHNFSPDKIIIVGANRKKGEPYYMDNKNWNGIKIVYQVSDTERKVIFEKFI